MMMTISKTKAFKITVVIFVLVMTAYVALWSIGFFLIDSLAQQYFFDREARLGRKWECSERKTSGFLITLGYDCIQARVITAGRDGPVKVAVGGLSARWDIARPNQLALHALSPAQISVGDKDTAQQISWTTLEASLSVSSRSTQSLYLNGVDIRSAAPRYNGEYDVGISQLNATIYSRASEFETRELQAILTATGISTGALDKVFGDDAASNFSSELFLKRAERLLGQGAPAEKLERWRSAEGTLLFDNLIFTRGRLKIEATGKLELDAVRRPQGQISGRAAGLSSLLKVIGMPDRRSTAAGFLGGLLAVRSSLEGNVAPERLVPFAFILRDGSVWLGPIKTPLTLKPLF